MFCSDLYLQHYVGVVIGLDVIEADDSRQVGGPIVCSVQFALLIQPRNMLFRERWFQHILGGGGGSDKSGCTSVQFVLVLNICW